MLARTPPYRVLIVDDDPDHVTLIEVVFAHLDANARVSVTWSAEEAIALLQGRHHVEPGPNGDLPDVIVLDINMPGLGGVGFLEWYSGEPDFHGIPVVVFTSSDDRALAARCKELGAREFMEKPSDFTKLVPLVHSVLERWQPPGWSAADSA